MDLVAASAASSSPIQPLRLAGGRSGVCRRTGGCRGIARPMTPAPGGEDAHVDADLGDDRFGGAPLNSGDRAQQLNGFLERGDLLGDHLGQAGDLFIEEIDVREDRSDQRMHGSKRPCSASRSAGSLERNRPRARSASACGSVVPERARRASRDPTPRDVRGDAIELDPGVLQRLVQPVGLTSAFLDLRLAIPGEVRSARIGLGGTKLARSDPASAADTTTPRQTRRSCGQGLARHDAR